MEFRKCGDCGLHGCFLYPNGDSIDVLSIYEGIVVLENLRNRGRITDEESEELLYLVETSKLPLDESEVIYNHNHGRNPCCCMRFTVFGFTRIRVEKAPLN